MDNSPSLLSPAHLPATTPQSLHYSQDSLSGDSTPSVVDPEPVTMASLVAEPEQLPEHSLLESTQSLDQEENIRITSGHKRSPPELPEHQSPSAKRTPSIQTDDSGSTIYIPSDSDIILNFEYDGVDHVEEKVADTEFVVNLDSDFSDTDEDEVDDEDEEDEEEDDDEEEDEDEDEEDEEDLMGDDVEMNEEELEQYKAQLDLIFSNNEALYDDNASENIGSEEMLESEALNSEEDTYFDHTSDGSQVHDSILHSEESLDSTITDHVEHTYMVERDDLKDSSLENNPEFNMSLNASTGDELVEHEKEPTTPAPREALGESSVDEDALYESTTIICLSDSIVLQTPALLAMGLNDTSRKNSDLTGDVEDENTELSSLEKVEKLDFKTDNKLEQVPDSTSHLENMSTLETVDTMTQNVFNESNSQAIAETTQKSEFITQNDQNSSLSTHDTLQSSLINTQQEVPLEAAPKLSEINMETTIIPPKPENLNFQTPSSESTETHHGDNILTNNTHSSSSSSTSSATLGVENSMSPTSASKRKRPAPTLPPTPMSMVTRTRAYTGGGQVVVPEQSLSVPKFMPGVPIRDILTPGVTPFADYDAKETIREQIQSMRRSCGTLLGDSSLYMACKRISKDLPVPSFLASTLKSDDTSPTHPPTHSIIETRPNESSMDIDSTIPVVPTVETTNSLESQASTSFLSMDVTPSTNPNTDSNNTLSTYTINTSSSITATSTESSKLSSVESEKLTTLVHDYYRLHNLDFDDTDDSDMDEDEELTIAKRHYLHEITERLSWDGRQTARKFTEADRSMPVDSFLQHPKLLLSYYTDAIVGTRLPSEMWAENMQTTRSSRSRHLSSPHAGFSSASGSAMSSGSSTPNGKAGPKGKGKGKGAKLDSKNGKATPPSRQPPTPAKVSPLTSSSSTITPKKSKSAATALAASDSTTSPLKSRQTSTKATAPTPKSARASSSSSASTSGQVSKSQASTRKQVAIESPDHVRPISAAGSQHVSHGSLGSSPKLGRPPGKSPISGKRPLGILHGYSGQTQSPHTVGVSTSLISTENSSIGGSGATGPAGSHSPKLTLNQQQKLLKKQQKSVEKLYKKLAKQLEKQLAKLDRKLAKHQKRKQEGTHTVAQHKLNLRNQALYQRFTLQSQQTQQVVQLLQTQPQTLPKLQELSTAATQLLAELAHLVNSTLLATTQLLSNSGSGALTSSTTGKGLSLAPSGTPTTPSMLAPGTKPKIIFKIKTPTTTSAVPAIEESGRGQTFASPSPTSLSQHSQLQTQQLIQPRGITSSPATPKQVTLNQNKRKTPNQKNTTPTGSHTHQPSTPILQSDSITHQKRDTRAESAQGRAKHTINAPQTTAPSTTLTTHSDHNYYSQTVGNIPIATDTAVGLHKPINLTKPSLVITKSATMPSVSPTTPSNNMNLPPTHQTTGDSVNQTTSQNARPKIVLKLFKKNP